MRVVVGVRAGRWHREPGTCVGAAGSGVWRGAGVRRGMRLPRCDSALSRYWRKEDIIWIRALLATAALIPAISGGARAIGGSGGVRV